MIADHNIGDDLVWAISTLGFDDYVSPLKLYLTKYRQAAKAEKSERPSGRARTAGMDIGGIVSKCVDETLTMSNAQVERPREPQISSCCPSADDQILERQLADFIQNDESAL